jgi:RNA polymerase sigma-70 factor (ECF subfamily)
MPTVDSDHLALLDAYEKYGVELLHFAASLVGPDIAQDVVSQTFLNCLQSRAWDAVVDPRAYLYRATRNEARKHFRTEQRRAAREQRHGTPRVALDQPPVPTELLRVINSLSLQQRSVVYLAYWLDLDAAAISELLGISPGAVHRHLARARATLRKRVDRNG